MNKSAKIIFNFGLSFMAVSFLFYTIHTSDPLINRIVSAIYFLVLSIIVLINIKLGKEKNKTLWAVISWGSCVLSFFNIFLANYSLVAILFRIAITCCLLLVSLVLTGDARSKPVRVFKIKFGGK